MEELFYLLLVIAIIVEICWVLNPEWTSYNLKPFNFVLFVVYVGGLFTIYWGLFLVQFVIAFFYEEIYLKYNRLDDNCPTEVGFKYLRQLSAIQLLILICVLICKIYLSWLIN